MNPRAVVPRLQDDPSIARVQMVYWVESTILLPGDPEDQRPVVVLAAPEATTGTMTVVVRSSTEAFGVEHAPDRRLLLSAPGRFCRRHPVQCQLWTPRNVAPAGLLDDATFAAVLERFAW